MFRLTQDQTLRVRLPQERHALRAFTKRLKEVETFVKAEEEVDRTMRRISKGWLVVAMICLLQPLSAKIGRAEVVDRIVAEVNDEIITMFGNWQAASKSSRRPRVASPRAKMAKNSNARCWRP